MAPSSRDSFLRRIKTVDNASTDPFLIDRVLTDTDHNDRARLLRNGLMVVAFTSLEDFIRARTGDLLDVVSRTIVHFSDLPEVLRIAATMGAIKAARSRADMAKGAGEDPTPLLQEMAMHVASTAGGALQMSKYSLAYSGSNVSSSEIGQIVSSFHVQDAWNEITLIASRCGAGSMPLKPAYDQAMRLRHSAAHRPDANIQPRDLQTFCAQATAIALGFDIIASRAARLLRDGDPTILASKVKISSGMKVRFFDEAPRGFAERLEGQSRAVKLSTDVDTGLKAAIANAAKHCEPVVLRDRRGLPISWRITDTV